MKKIIGILTVTAIVLGSAKSYAQTIPSSSSISTQLDAGKAVVKTQGDTTVKDAKTNVGSEGTSVVNDVKAGKVTNVSTAKTEVTTSASNVKTSATTTAKAGATKVADKVVGKDSKGRKVYEDVHSKKYTITSAGKKEFIN